jgi:recombination protein RecA
MGLRCGFVDAEKTWDPKFARHLGVDLKALAFERQHEHGERCIDVIEAMLYSELFDVIVLDSIAALLPKAEKDVQMDNTSYGTQQAKLMSKALRKLTTANRKTVLIYINQQRESVGSLYGPKMVTSGGRAMAFYAGTRLELSQVENIMSAQDLVDPKTGNTVSKQVVKAHRVLIRVAKDKTGARPGDQTTVVFDYKLSDFDPLEDLMYLGRRLGLVKQRKSGKTYSWWIEGHEDLKKLGRNNFKAWLSRNPTHADELEDLICNYEGEEE